MLLAFLCTMYINASAGRDALGNSVLKRLRCPFMFQLRFSFLFLHYLIRYMKSLDE